MRDIIFRGKREDNGEWVEGYYVCVSGVKYYILTGNPVIAPNNITIECYGVIPETVGQFTGLTDNNGERIWEGDIVRCKQERNNEGICVVRWFNGAFVACSISGNLLEMTLHDYWYNDYDLVEIIGNETDNPELLKGE